MSKTPQSKVWFFTWNNSMASWTMQKLVGPDVVNWAMQDEKVSRWHTQGVIEFNVVKTLLELKKINKDIHWEKCITIKGSVSYCTDLRKRHPDGWTYISKGWDKYRWTPERWWKEWYDLNNVRVVILEKISDLCLFVRAGRSPDNLNCTHPLPSVAWVWKI